MLKRIFICFFSVLLCYNLTFCSAFFANEDDDKPKRGFSTEIVKKIPEKTPLWVTSPSKAPTYSGYVTFVGRSNEIQNEDKAVSSALLSALKQYALYKGVSISVNDKLIRYDSGSASAGIDSQYVGSNETKLVATEFLKGMKITEIYKEYYNRYLDGVYFDNYCIIYLVVKVPEL